VNPFPDPLLLRKSGNAGNWTWDLWICSQELWPLDHRGGPLAPNLPILIRIALLAVCFMPVFWLTNVSNLRMEAIRFTETSIGFHQTTLHCIPELVTLHIYVVCRDCYMVLASDILPDVLSTLKIFEKYSFHFLILTSFRSTPPRELSFSVVYSPIFTFIVIVFTSLYFWNVPSKRVMLIQSLLASR
jgi:hypothetical protein